MVKIINNTPADSQHAGVIIVIMLARRYYHLAHVLPHRATGTAVDSYFCSFLKMVLLLN